MASMSLRFFKGKKLGTYLMLLSRNGGMLKGSGKQLRRDLPEVEWTTASTFHVFYRFYMKGCYSLTLHALPPISRTCHGWIWKSGKHTEGGRKRPWGFNSSQIRQTPTGKLALGLAGTLKEKKNMKWQDAWRIWTPWRISKLTRERRCWLRQAK